MFFEIERKIIYFYLLIYMRSRLPPPRPSGLVVVVVVVVVAVVVVSYCTYIPLGEKSDLTYNTINRNLVEIIFHIILRCILINIMKTVS
jgi:hypothetical protein